MPGSSSGHHGRRRTQRETGALPASHLRALGSVRRADTGEAAHSPDAAAHVLPSVHLLAQVKGSQTKWISGFQDKMFYHEPETILEVAHYFPMSPVSKRMSYTEQRMLLTATVASEHCYPSRKRCVRKTGL